MKVVEILENWTDNNIRTTHSRNLIAILTPMSVNELIQSKIDHNPLQSLPSFLEEQQNILARILNFECSELGKRIREEHGLDVLTMDMEI